jgi:hypothetical protein
MFRPVSLFYPPSADLYGARPAGFQTVSAVGTVHLIGARPHFTDFQAGVAIVACVRLEYLEKGDAFDQLEYASHGTRETAPQVGYKEPRDYQPQHDGRADKPGGERVFE